MFRDNGESMFYTYDYNLAKESTDFLRDGYIQVNKRRTIPLANSEIYYIDLETTVLGFHKTTGKPEPLQEYPVPDVLMWVILLDEC